MKKNERFLLIAIFIVITVVLIIVSFLNYAKKDNQTSNVKNNNVVNNKENIVNTTEKQNVKKESKEERYKNIFLKMKDLLLNNPEEAYNCLDENYKKIRFPNYDFFLEYLNKNKERLEEIEVSKYKLLDNKKYVVIQDQNKDRYQFELLENDDFKFRLDNYIVLNIDDEELLEGYSDENKVKYNIKRWLKMIERGDYEFAYNFLDSKFKENYYSSYQEFVNYINQKQLNRYSVASSKVEKEGNIYSANVELSIIGENYKEIYYTVIMKLGENGKFILSFSEQ